MANTVDHHNAQANVIELLETLWQQGLEVWLEKENNQVGFRGNKSLLQGDVLETLRSQKPTIIEHLKVEPNAFTGIPLSAGQQGIFLAQQAASDKPIFNLCSAILLHSHIDIAALEQALAELPVKHTMLTASFHQTEKHIYQQLNPDSEITLENITLDANQSLDETIHNLAQQSFDLTDSKLFRLYLISQNNQFYLVSCCHHLVADFWGLQVALKDLQDLYQAKLGQQCVNTTIHNAEQNSTYKDYVLTQNSWLQSDTAKQVKDHWQQQIKQWPEQNELPEQQKPNNIYQGEQAYFNIEKSLKDKLQAQAKKHQVSLFTWVLGCYQQVLFKLTNADTLPIGIAMANRDSKQWQQMVGHFTNPLPMICKRKDHASQNLLSQSNQKQLQQLWQQQSFAIENIQQLKNDQEPLFQYAFSWNQMDQTSINNGLLFAEVYKNLQCGSLFDLVLTAVDSDQGIDFSIRYNPEQFSSNTINRFIGYITAALTQSCQEEPPALAQLNLANAQEQKTLASINKPYKPLGTINLFEEAQKIATQQPDAIAVIEAEKSYSYQALFKRANDYAHIFKQLGCGEANNIALHLPRGFELFAGILGTLQVGAAYVPIDLEYPTERIKYMLQAASAKVLICLPENQNNLASVNTDNQYTILSCADIATERNLLPAAKVAEDQLTCILFTSGSTGKPKAVALSQKPLYRISVDNGFLTMHPGEHFLSISNISFDAINLEIWCSLLNGASIYVIDKDTLLSPQSFAQEIAKTNNAAMMITTALFNALIDIKADIFEPCKSIMTGGEAASQKHLLTCLEQGSPQELWHVYGPTENGTFSTAHLLEKADCTDLSISIGHSVGRSKSYVLDKDNQPCLIGVKGEIVVAGDGLALGYIEQALNENRFVTDITDPKKRMYRTGDLGFISNNGVLFCTGRIDDQIKIRGHRIELPEIQHAISLHPDIEQSFAHVQQDNNNAKQIVAFFVANNEVNTSELRQFLQQRLPSFMLPQAFKQLDALPLNANGKVDKKQLPQLECDLTQEYIAPETATEKIIASIWEQAFNIERLSTQANFFDLGGHSLLATKISAKLQEHFAQSINIRLIFDNPSIYELAAALDNQTSDASISTITAIATHNKTLAAAATVQRLWFVQQLNTESTVYNMPVAIQLPQAINEPAFKDALTKLQTAHEVLNYRFIDQDGKAYIEYDSAAFKDIDYETCNLSSLNIEAAQQQANDKISKLSQTVFNLAQGSLFKALLIQLPNQQSILAFCLHHIIADGWSVNLLLQQLAQLLNDSNAHIPHSGISYRDYSHWQQQLSQSNSYQQQVNYWQQQLNDAPESLNLPIDTPRPAVLSSEGAVHHFGFNADQSEKIRTLARSEQASSFMVLIAAYQFLLSRYCGSDDICVGFPVAGRQQAGLENMVGLFVNNLVLRHKYQAEHSVSDFIQTIKNNVLAAQANQDVPFDKVLEALAVNQSLSYTPFLQASFSLEESTLAQGLANIFGDNATLLDTGWQVAKYDIHLSCFDSGTGNIEAMIEYNKELFKPETIAQISRHFEAICEAFSSSNNTPLAKLQFLSEAEIEQQTNTQKGFNATDFEYPEYQSVIDIFEQTVEKHSSATAVSDAIQSLNYQSLNNRANQLARLLNSQGVTQNDAVIVCLERSVNLSISLLAILKIGACYVPILPDTPAERVKHIIEQTKSKVLVTQESLANSINSFEANTKLLIVDSDATQNTLANMASDNINAQISKDSLFNIIYTSGSTGTPKGVMVPHQGIINRLLWMQQQYQLQPCDTVLQKTPFNFDVSVWELFWPLLVGSKLFFAKPEGHKDPEYLAQVIKQQNISHLHFVPSMLAIFLQSPNIQSCNTIKAVFASGEALQKEHCEKFFEVLPQAQLHNLYGPTEASIDVSYFDCKKHNDYQSVPIGKPIHNTQLLVLDEQLNLLPQGAIGELYIAGKNLAKGYLAQEALSAKSFIQSPFIKQIPQSPTLYKTGDLCRQMPDGNLLYLGRSDQQIKIRGLRIELQDIEAQIRLLNNIDDTVVVIELIHQEPQIVAFYTGSTLPNREFHKLLQPHLPRYMVPITFIAIDQIPLSANGKIDRKQLPFDVIASSLTQTEYVAPRNETEEALQQIWQQLLGHEPIGIYDNFFKLGGHSLLATKLASQIREQFQCELPLKAIFDNPNISELAVVILADTLEQLDLSDIDLASLLDEIDN